MKEYHRLHFLLFFSAALFFPPGVSRTFAISPSGSGSHTFPHFFSESSDRSDNYLLRFNKGIICFSDRQVFFRIIESQNPKSNMLGPEDMMNAAATVQENIVLRFAGANSCTPTGVQPLASRSNYFIGSNSDKWKRDLQNYEALEYRDLYNGIDLKYYVVNNEVKYDYVVKPGGRVEEIKMHYEGVKSLWIDSGGALHIRTKLTELKDYLPKSYQFIAGKEVPVTVHYRLLGNRTVGFYAGEYDKNYPLIIDPALIYSTFVGGSSDEYQWVGSIDHDAAGNIYHTGRTFSANFPSTGGAYQTTFGGSYDAYVFKLDPTGTTMVYSTFIGGANVDAGYSVKVEQATGNLWVTGSTDSPTFPVTAGAFQTVNGGTGLTDAFVLKLNAAGNGIIYSTLFGQAYSDYGHGIDIDNVGDVYLCGKTNGTVYTTAGAFQNAYGGGPWDGFVTKFNSTLSSVLYSTLFGSVQHEVPIAIAVDQNKDIYIAGFEEGGSMPVVAGSFDITYNGGSWDAFVTKFNATLSSLYYSTYLGTSGTDMIWNALKVNSAGEAIVAGFAASGFPTTAGAFQTTYGGGLEDVFVAKLNAAGSALVYSTYVGGTGDDEAYGVFADSNGDVYVTGFCQANFPYTQCTYDSTYNGGKDAFLLQLNSNASQLLFSTYFGGSGDDLGYNITVLNGRMYVVGETQSANFPVSAGAFDNSYNGLRDLFAFAMDQTVVVITANFTAANSICPASSIQFNNTSMNATAYQWDFGDGNSSILQNPQHSFTVPGWYDVQLIATAPCGVPDTFMLQVHVLDPPSAMFNSNITCGLSVNFTDASTGAATYSWDFGDGTTSGLASPYHSYSSGGSYLVTLIVTDASGCSDTVQQQVTTSPLPVASFNALPPGCNMVVDMQNNSANAATYSWDFGDGTTSTQSNPFHQYGSAGIYTIMLIAEPGPCADTSFQSVEVTAPPIASFSYLAGCNLVCDFTNASSGAAAYNWDFGDGSTSLAASPAYTYAGAGSYTVTLVVTDLNGCSDTVSSQVQILPVPVAAFSTSANLCSLFVSFQNTSANATSSVWNFGDGGTSTLTSPSHSFSDTGTYLVTLIVNPGQCPDTFSQSVTVHTSPVAYFTAVPQCELACLFGNNSSQASAYFWDFGDTYTSTATSPSHSYASAGNYTVTLYAENQYGCVDTLQQLISINPNPVAQFSFNADPCALLVPFQNLSSNGSSFLWLFGDGTSSSQISPAHEYLYSGTFDVTLIVDPVGCADTVTQSLSVSQPPSVTFSSTVSCSYEIPFQNTSNSASAYMWDFGDGTQSSDASPVHTYASTGMYSVTLVGSNASGCSDTMVQQVDVVIFSPAAFESTYDTCLLQAAFYSTSPVAGSYYWDFGDGSTSQTAGTIHQYPYPAVFNMLFITNRGTSCADTLQEEFDAAPAPEHGFYIPNCFTPNGDGLNDQFSVIDFGNCDAYQLLIFNRWGELVFETNDLRESWDGSYKGAPALQDVYCYLLKGNGRTKEGSVLLLLLNQEE